MFASISTSTPAVSIHTAPAGPQPISASAAAATACMGGGGTKHLHVAIIGGGPRGLLTLERLHASLAAYNLDAAGQGVRVSVHLVEPGTPGEGVHGADHPSHFILNTAAGQVSAWGDDGESPAGPSLLEWVRAAGYRMVDGQVLRTPDAGRDIRADDFLPRCILGEYLRATYDCLAERIEAHPGLDLVHHRSAAVDVRPRGERLEVVLQGGFALPVDYAVLATGQTPPRPSDADQALLDAVAALRGRNPQLAFMPYPFPLDGLKGIAPGARVAVHGMGLTAHDVVAALTAGRGGRFERTTGGALRYVPSGREPRLLLFSQTGFAAHARAASARPADAVFVPHFLTRAEIDRLRAAREAQGAGPQLDFQRDVFPLLFKEMCHAHHRASAGDAAVPPTDYEPGPAEAEAVRTLLARDESARYRDADTFAATAAAQLADDLASARAGVEADPLKAAADVLREARDVLRYAVEYGGLTPEGHADYFAFARRANQVCGAPPAARNEQLLALVQAGIVRFGPGPDPEWALDADTACFTLRSTRLDRPATVQADVLIRARVGGFLPERDGSALYANLLESGLVRPYLNGEYHPGGLDIDGRHRVIDAQGRVQPRLAAVGPPTEGPNLWTPVLPGAGVGRRPVADAAQVAANVTALIEQDARRPARTLTAAEAARLPPEQVHPRTRRGEAVHIEAPTRPSPSWTWLNANARRIFVPGAPTPDQLNGLALRSWTPPRDLAGWIAASTEDIAIDRPYPLNFAQGGHRTGGAIIVEPGREPCICLVKPTNAYGAEYTLPQGRAEEGEPVPVATRREVYEETGLLVRLRAVVGDYGNEYDPTPAAERGTGGNFVRYFEAVRIDGTPRDAGWETQGLVFVPLSGAKRLLTRPRDRRILADYEALLAARRSAPAPALARPRDQKQLVLHGPHIPESWLARLARLAQAEGDLSRLAPGSRHREAWRLTDVRDSARLRAALEALRDALHLDHAVVPLQALSDVGLMVSDVDSTFVTGDYMTALARRRQVLDQLVAMRRAVKAEPPPHNSFARSMRLGTAMLAGATREDIEGLHRDMPLTAGATDMVRDFAGAGATVALASSGFTAFTGLLREAHGLHLDLANVLETDGQDALTGRMDPAHAFVDGRRKVEWVDELLDELALPRGMTVVAVGDNDAPLFEGVHRHGGLAVAYSLHNRSDAAEAAADAVFRHAGLDAVANLFVRV